MDLHHLLLAGLPGALRFAPDTVAKVQNRTRPKISRMPIIRPFCRSRAGCRMFQSLVNLGNGRIIGRNFAKFWGNGTDASAIGEALQTLQPIGSPEFTQLEAIFKNWNSWIIDIPGTYYLKVIEKLYKRNELASGSFLAVGQKRHLARRS